MSSISSSRSEGYDVRSALLALRRRWWVVLLSMLLVGGLFYGAVRLRAESYTATARLIYEPVDLMGVVSVQGSSSKAVHNVTSDVSAIRTRELAESVASTLPNRPSAKDLLDSVSAEAFPELNVIEVTGTSQNPETAAAIANGFGEKFVEARQERARQVISRARESLKQRIDTLTPADANSEYGLALKQRYGDLGAQLDLQQSDFRVLDPAVVPQSPSSIQPVTALIIGLLLGFLLGVALALLLEHLDTRLRDEASVEQELGLPVLATVPIVGDRWGRHPNREHPAVGFRHGNEMLLESSRMLRSTLKLMGFGKTNKVLMVTSAIPQEGKTSTAINLALGMALLGDRVILIDTDLRMPKVHSYLQLSNVKGLEDVLAQGAEFKEVAQPVDLRPFVIAEMVPPGSGSPGFDGQSLYVVTSGQTPSNPAEILDSLVMKKVLEQLRLVSDYIILDGPPMLTVSDSLSLLRSVDAVIVANRLGATTSREARRLRKTLDRAGANVLGVVLTGVKQRSRDHYHDYYNVVPESTDVDRHVSSGTRAETEDLVRDRTRGGGSRAPVS